MADTESEPVSIPEFGAFTVRRRLRVVNRCRRWLRLRSDRAGEIVPQSEAHRYLSPAVAAPFTHLRIDEDLPEIYRWPVDRVYLTQIGKSAPAHNDLVGVVSELRPRARPAYDGLEVEL